MALEPAPCASCHCIDQRVRSARRLLEKSTEAARRFHPIRSIEPQPLRDRSQMIWNRPALVRAEFPPRAIEQREIMIDVDREDTLVRRAHMQTPQISERGGNAEIEPE